MADNVILAIDPGLTGAIAFFASIDNSLSVFDMPVMGSEVNPFGIQQMLDTYRPATAVIERVGPMPRDGVMQAWRFSATYAVVKTVVMLNHIPLRLIPASVWKKALHVKGGLEGKEQCRAKAIQMFPANAADFARKKDTGRAEAALLAFYLSLEEIKPGADAGGARAAGE